MAFNIMINTKCNLSCPFCFASTIVNKKQHRLEEMKGEDFEFILSLLKGKIKTVTLMGGEPTLHKNFLAFIEKSLSEGFNIMLLTNGCWSQKVRESLTKLPSNRIKYCINLNEYMRQEIVEKVTDNLMHIDPDSIILSVNIDRINFNFDFYKKLIKHIPVRAVRWSYSLPGGDNRFLNKSDYSHISESLIAFFDFLLKRDIEIISDHLVPLCVFNKKQVDYFSQKNIKIKTKCSPIVDILPDLTVINCFPLFGKIDSLKLSEFNSIEDIYKEFKNMLNNHNHFADPKCKECEMFNKICSGGCLALRI